MFYLKHKFKDKVFVPYVAISDNIKFLFTKGEKEITTTDNVVCTAINVREIHIAEEEADKLSKSLYGLDIIELVRRWHKANKEMTSMFFVTMELIKQ